MIALNHVEYLESLGTTWQAEPLCDAPRGLLALELHVISFDSNYYGTAKGILIPIVVHTDLIGSLRP